MWYIKCTMISSTRVSFSSNKYKSGGVRSRVGVGPSTTEGPCSFSFAPSVPSTQLSSGACYVMVPTRLLHHRASCLNARRGAKQRKKEPCPMILSFLFIEKTKAFPVSISSLLLFIALAFILGHMAAPRPVTNNAKLNNCDQLRLSRFIPGG